MIKNIINFIKNVFNNVIIQQEYLIKNINGL